jgi:FkbM family methyltransferase
VDVGAFVGKYTIDVALQSPHNRVLAIEPNPISFSILMRNIKLNNVEKQVILVNEAVSDSRCKVAFKLSGSVSKIAEARSSENIKTIEVNALPLFEILERHGINTSDIRLIKIDVEGYEHVVLKQICGKANELSGVRIICEILPDDPQKESNLRQMATVGFRARKIDENNYLFFK